METKTKRKAGRPSANRDESLVRMDRAMITQVKMIAVARRISVADVLRECCAAPLARAYNAAVANNATVAGSNS
jgi:hypothetical protein